MRKNDMNAIDELRPEYQRSDFGKLVRGKYASRLSEETNIVVLEPDVAKFSIIKKLSMKLYEVY